MSFIDDYRKILKRRIKEYNWNDIQTEIELFFKEIHRVNIPESSKYCLKNFALSEEKILEKFNLNEKKLKDVMYIDRIYEMLKYIKEINFCFPNIWMTYNYHHHNHGYKIKDLLEVIKDEIKEMIHFKVDKFDLLMEKQEDFHIIENFIDLNFLDFGLPYYQNYVRLINGIAYHPDFYMILPHLLRSLFENLLQDIFSQSLVDSCSDLYYNKKLKRYNDFSKLIALLDLLREDEFGPYIGGKITQDTIKALENIREKGNISIHDIEEKITTAYANEIKDLIVITLNPLLVAYKKLNGKNIHIERKRKYSIKVKLGIIKEDKKNKKLNLNRDEQFEDLSISEISTLMSEIRTLIYSDSPDYVTNIRNKMDELLLKVKSLNLDDRKLNALRKAYILFNETLQVKPPMKLTLQSLFDAINIIIL